MSDSTVKAADAAVVNPLRVAAEPEAGVPIGTAAADQLSISRQFPVEASPATGAEAPQEAPDATESGEQGEGKPSEARLRKRAREAEQARNELAVRLEKLQTKEIKRLLPDGLTPKALWASNIQLTDLLDDEGEVDPAKVAAAADKARDELGIPKPTVGNLVPGIGNRPAPPRADGWTDAFAPKRG